MQVQKNMMLRILSALILIPLVVWGIFAVQQLYFVGISTVIILLAAWEWSRLAGWVNYGLRIFYCLVTFALLPLLHFAAYLTSFTLVFFIGTLWWLVVLGYLFYVRQRTTLLKLPNSVVVISGFLSLAMCWEALLILHQKPILLMCVLVFIWLADTFAYFGGRLWGKRKLAVTISPNKTLEGLLCGVIASLVVGALAQWFFMTPGELHVGLFLTIALTIVISVVGDLFESVLKRQQGLKDSGKLLPGHGGILDRLDSLISAAPVFTLGVLMTGLIQ